MDAQDVRDQLNSIARYERVNEATIQSARSDVRIAIVCGAIFALIMILCMAL